MTEQLLYIYFLMVRIITYFLPSRDNYYGHFGDFFLVLFLMLFVYMGCARAHLLLQCSDGIVNKVWIPDFLFNGRVFFGFLCVVLFCFVFFWSLSLFFFFFFGYTAQHAGS